MFDIEPQIEDFENDIEKCEYFQRIVNNYATSDGLANDEHYQLLRKYFLEKVDTKLLVPDWIRTHRDLKQFWGFIKGKFSTYSQRREFILNEFEPLISYLETKNKPHINEIEVRLVALNSTYIQDVWQKAVERCDKDPEGAITTSRSLVEGVVKHILDEKGVVYADNLDLSELYKILARELNLDSNAYTEELFKRILSSCSNIVNCLGSLRNKAGDAHGKGKSAYKPLARHARLAVNVAGSLAAFIVDTYKSTKI